jgi:hypothetical protein
MSTIDLNNFKITTLLLIAKEFNKNNIMWALGGSLMLYLRGYQVSFHDIDLVIDKKYIKETKKILLNLGTLLPPKDNKSYKTLFFEEYIINGVDIDIMADVIYEGSDFVLSLDQKDIDKIMINNVEIPLHSVEKWRELYVAIGRNEKVKLIDSFNK